MAPIPVNRGKPEPATLTPAGRSSSPSETPSSQCGLGDEVEHRRLAPGAHQAVGGGVAVRQPCRRRKVRQGERQRSSAASISRSRASSSFTSSPDALSRSMRSSAGSLARFRRATSSLAALRSALSASTRTSSSRRWRSSSSMASMSGGERRDRRGASGWRGCRRDPAGDA